MQDVKGSGKEMGNGHTTSLHSETGQSYYGRGPSGIATRAKWLVYIYENISGPGSRRTLVK